MHSGTGRPAAPDPLMLQWLSGDPSITLADVHRHWRAIGGGSPAAFLAALRKAALKAADAVLVHGSQGLGRVQVIAQRGDHRRWA